MWGHLAMDLRQGELTGRCELARSGQSGPGRAGRAERTGQPGMTWGLSFDLVRVVV